MDKVEVLISLYDPNKDFLVQQLESLDEQDYEDLEIVIYDDCIDRPFDVSILDQYIKRKKYRILPTTGRNLGYAKAFEYLVRNSNAEYLAFCDQDDVWSPDKISKCVQTLKKENTLLVATDYSIIDQNDNVIIESVRRKSTKKWQKWKSYDDICKYNFFNTYALGMCIVVDGELARRAVPFSNNTGHDKWIIACASAEGKVSYLDDVLAKYRRHGQNVSGMMKGINCKKDYYENRIMKHNDLLVEFHAKYPYIDISEPKAFMEARKNANILSLLKYRYLASDIVKLEIVMAFMPDFIMRKIINILKK